MTKYPLNKDEEYTMKILEELRKYLAEKGYWVAIGLYLSIDGKENDNTFSTINMPADESESVYIAAGKISHHIVSTYLKCL